MISIMDHAKTYRVCEKRIWGLSQELGLARPKETYDFRQSARATL